MPQKKLNEACQLVFSGLKEIVGQKELTRLLAADPKRGMDDDPERNPGGEEFSGSQDLDKIQTAMENRFGKNELQGLLLRSGRASCKFFVRQYGAGMQVTSVEYRLLPSKKRLSKGLKAAADLCSELFQKEISLIDKGEKWLWLEKRSFPGLASNHPAHERFFTIGLLQEYMAWLSGGKAFSIKPFENDAPVEGADCLAIEKQPLE